MEKTDKLAMGPHGVPGSQPIGPARLTSGRRNGPKKASSQEESPDAPRPAQRLGRGPSWELQPSMARPPLRIGYPGLSMDSPRAGWFGLVKQYKSQQAEYAESSWALRSVTVSDLVGEPPQCKVGRDI